MTKDFYLSNIIIGLYIPIETHPELLIGNFDGFLSVVLLLGKFLVCRPVQASVLAAVDYSINAHNSLVNKEYITL